MALKLVQPIKMNRTWNLKLFISISLGLHLFVLSCLSILMPNMKITRLPPLNMEVSLVPFTREEASLKKAEDKFKVPSLARPAMPNETGGIDLKPIKAYSPEEVHSKEEPPTPIEKKEEDAKTESLIRISEEPEIPKTEKVEIAHPEKEEETVAALSVQSEVKVIPVTDPKPFPFQSEKRIIGGKQEEKTVIASLGNPLPQVSSFEEMRTVMRSPSLSEVEMVFTQPRYAKNPKPLYPREAKKKGYEGEVLLRVEVLSNGRVGEIEVKRSSGHEALDHSAMTAVKQWKFIPAQKGETPIPVWVNIPVAFQLR